MSKKAKDCLTKLKMKHPDLAPFKFGRLHPAFSPGNVRGINMRLPHLMHGILPSRKRE